MILPAIDIDNFLTFYGILDARPTGVVNQASVNFIKKPITGKMQV